MKIEFNEIEIRGDKINNLKKNNKIEIKINDNIVFTGSIINIDMNMETITDIKEKSDSYINNLSNNQKLEFILDIRKGQ